jgi:Ca2+-binding RTX toxin-like protein
VDFTGSEWIQFLAFTATQADIDAFNAVNAVDIDLTDGVDTATFGNVNTTGDLRVGEGVEAYNIADISGGGRIVDTTGSLDDADDPVAITGLGKAGPGKLDAATMDAGDTGNRVIFSNDLGFGFIGGSGFETAANAIRINDGESVNFEIKQDKKLLEASFTVKVLGSGSTVIVIDSDGATIKDTNGDAQGGFVQDASAGELSLGMLSHGDTVRIDYINELIYINNVLFAGDDSAFFDTFEVGGSADLTLGSAVDNLTGWTADNVVLLADIVPDGIVAALLPATCNDPDPTDSLTAAQDLTFLFLGDDVIVGNGGGNIIVGLTGADTIYGRGGDDAVGGGIGADVLYGQAGNDLLGGENITGYIAGGADMLFGGSGNDLMFGGDLGDTLVGGHGADTMYGDIDLGIGPFVAHADVFLFLDACDTNDVIADFDQGQDLIDLSALYAGALAFDPDNGAGFDAAYSVSFFDDGTDTTVIVELDGDIATAELAITLLGVYTLTAGDFVL